MGNNGNKNNGSKTAISILAGSVIVAIALYLGLTQAKPSFAPHQTANQPAPTIAISPSPQPTSAPNPTSTSQPSPTPSPSPRPEIVWKKSDLIAALSQKTGIPEDEIKFDVGDEIKREDKTLLRGTVSREGEMGGAGFFAVVDSSGVQVTYAGQGVPQCSEVNPYGYPISWADYCVNSQGQTVAR